MFIFFKFGCVLPFLRVVLAGVLGGGSVGDGAGTDSRGTLFTAIPVAMLPVPVIDALIEIRTKFIELINGDRTLPVAV